LERRQEMNVPRLNCWLLVEVTADVHSEIGNLSPCRHIQNFSSRTISGTPWAKAKVTPFSIVLLLHHFRPSFQFSVHSSCCSDSAYTDAE